jgi:hypothetical protein
MELMYVWRRVNITYAKYDVVTEAKFAEYM